MGLGRFELPTPRLSSVCSNQLSYRPERYLQESFKEPKAQPLAPSKLDRRALTFVNLKPAVEFHVRSIFRIGFQLPAFGCQLFTAES